MPKCLRCGEVGGHHAAGCWGLPRATGGPVVVDDEPREMTPEEWQRLKVRLLPSDQPPAAEQGGEGGGA